MSVSATLITIESISVFRFSLTKDAVYQDANERLQQNKGASSGSFAFRLGVCCWQQSDCFPIRRLGFSYKHNSLVRLKFSVRLATLFSLCAERRFSNSSLGTFSAGRRSDLISYFHQRPPSTSFPPPKLSRLGRSAGSQ